MWHVVLTVGFIKVDTLVEKVTYIIDTKKDIYVSHLLHNTQQYIYIYVEKLHTVVSTHLLYVGSNCCKAQGLDESVEDRLNLNTAPQFGTLVVPHCLYKKDCC